MKPSHRCTVWIPLTYGKSGKPVPGEVIWKFLTWFNRQFGGHTPLGLTGAPAGMSQGGFWTDPDSGELVEDRSFMVMVMVPQGQCEAFRRIANAIGHELEQKEMLVDIGPPSGEFLKIHDSGEIFIRDEVGEDGDQHNCDAQKQKGDGTLGPSN